MDDASFRKKSIFTPASVISNGLGMQKLLLTDLGFIFALHLAKTSLLSQSAVVSVLLTRILAYGIGLAFVWSVIAGKLISSITTVKWKTLALSSIIFYLRNIALLFALAQLPSSRAILIALHPGVLIRLFSSTVSPKMTIGLVLAFLSILIIDSGVYGKSVWVLLPAYAALALVVISSAILDYAFGSLVSTTGNAVVTMLSALGAWSLSNVINALFIPSAPTLTGHSFSQPHALFLTVACLFLTPLSSQQVLKLSNLRAHYQLHFLGLSVATLVMSAVFGDELSFADVLFSLWVLSVISVRAKDQGESTYVSVVPTIQRYVKVILANPESRKIFYFLLLNMCYMLVQMLYGIWTNSLGLISDAIHMAFDCMAIGIGLVASVMAKWTPNERFTYGYTRIETLSGFSNGIFLILISIFIVFEAIQRLLSPPEMNTSQLLLVSSIGLAVNLFGMFAMGGHHHHGGHSHSHGHSHNHSSHSGHSHSHSHSNPDAAEVAEHQSTKLTRELATQSRPKSVVDHLHLTDGSVDSPITPSYHFDHDEHLEHHHGHHPAGQSCESDSSHEGHSHNMRGVFLHVMADTLGSVGVIISTLLIQFYGWTGFDPIASLFIAVLIAASVVPLVIDAGKVLLLDLSDHTGQVQHALDEVSHISGLSSFTSQFWLKDDTTILGSVQLDLSKVPSVTEKFSDDAHVETQLVVEKVQNVFTDQIPGLQQISVQIGMFT